MRYLFILFFLISSCKPDWKLNKEHVAEQLRSVAADYPENKIRIETRLGDIELALDPRTKLHRINFIRLIKMGYFENRYFYRNIYDSGMQAGGEYFDRLDYLVPAEFISDAKPTRGKIAMARYDEDNPLKSSSPTEFFIITDTEEAKMYAGNYVVFGQVTKGMNVIDAIKKQRSFFEKPVTPVKFSIQVLD